jgi:hypothetical protein
MVLRRPVELAAFMGKFTLLGIRYDNPQQIDQSTLNWEKVLFLPNGNPATVGSGNPNLELTMQIRRKPLLFFSANSRHLCLQAVFKFQIPAPR